MKENKLLTIYQLLTKKLIVFMLKQKNSQNPIEELSSKCTQVTKCHFEKMRFEVFKNPTSRMKIC